MQVGARVATSYRALVRVERPPCGGRSNAGNATCSWGAQGPLRETRRRFGEKTLRRFRGSDRCGAAMRGFEAQGLAWTLTDGLA